jgi:small subunit ribosomal protein S4
MVKIKESSRAGKRFNTLAEKLKKKEVPGWLNFEVKEFSAKVLHAPAKENFEMKVNAAMIVEFYSR